MTIKQLINKTRAEINAKIARYNDLTGDINKARSEGADEASLADQIAARDAVKAEQDALTAKLRTYEADDAQEQEVQRALTEAENTPTGAPTPSQERSGVAIDEQRTYTKDNDPQGRNFVRDVAAAALGDFASAQRIGRHVQEERGLAERAGLEVRGITTGVAPGTVVPQYLLDMYASRGRPGRHLADMMRKHELPKTGMSVYIPSKKAGMSVAEQANQLDPVAESDYTDTDIEVKVRTAAGSGTMSRQSVERGLGTEDITVEDLIQAYHTSLDSILVNDATAGLLATSASVTYTDADPTALELYRKVLQAQAAVEDVVQDLDPEQLFTLMRSVRWAWLRAQATDLHPFISNKDGSTTFGTNVNGKPIRGYMPDGSAVVTDNNLPKNLGAGTNEDPVVIVDGDEAHLWEDPSAPMFLRAETGPSMKKLGIDLVLYGYFAFCFNRLVDEAGARVSVHQKITGSGLIVPTVF